MLDCSLKVYNVIYGNNIVGIMQSIDIENHNQSFSTIGGQNCNIQLQAPTATLKLLMTREQKALFAVMYRLFGKVDLSMEAFGQGTYRICGSLDISRELLKDFADKKHFEDEVEFVVENASFELVKEKKHGKSKARVH